MPFRNDDFKIVFTVGLFFFAMAFSAVIMIGEKQRITRKEKEVLRCSQLVHGRVVMPKEDRIDLCREIVK